MKIDQVGELRVASTVLHTVPIEQLAALAPPDGVDALLLTRLVPRAGSDGSGGLGLGALRQRVPALAALADRCEARGIRLLLSGVPDCILGSELADRCRVDAEVERAVLPAPDQVLDVAFDGESGRPTAGSTWGRERTELCRRCQRVDRCSGFDSTWLDRHGTRELRPFVAAVPERRLHVYGVGIAKTGSTSLARMFPDHRARHEHRFVEAVERAVAWRDRSPEPAELQGWLRERDAIESLEVECSTFLHPWAGALAELFPEARFLCPVRAPAGQVESLLNMMLRQLQRYDDSAPFPAWKQRYGELLFGRFDPTEFRSVEALRPALPDLVDRTLRYWADAHEDLLRDVPPDRVLFLRSEALSEATGSIAAFLDLEPEALEPAHANRGHGKQPLLEALDPTDLSTRVERICGPTLARLEARLGPSPHPVQG